MPWWDFSLLSWVESLRGVFQDKSSRRRHISNSNHSFTNIDFPLIDHQNEEYRTMEAPNVSHTVKSHGVSVARTHMYDWLILLLLVVIMAILLLMQPFYRFVGKDMMTDLRYPLKSNTVPFWAVPLYAGVLPLVIFLIVYYRRNDVYDLHHAILGLFYSLLVTEVITESIKLAVGRPRPDFFWRCFPDGRDEYDRWGNVICHGDKHVINEGHKSFPSGHTSISFAGMVYLSLYLSGKIKVFDRKGHIAKLCIVVLPLLVAAFVGISRVDDYWHHWQDVFAGGLLGLTVATCCYLQFFPPPYHAEGWGPYAYFHMLAELNVGTQEASTANSHSVRTLSVQTMGSRALNEQDERISTGFTGLHSAFNSSSSDLEAGRR